MMRLKVEKIALITVNKNEIICLVSGHKRASFTFVLLFKSTYGTAISAKADIKH